MDIAKIRKRASESKNIFDREARVSAPFLERRPGNDFSKCAGTISKKRKITTCEIGSVSISLAPHPHTLSYSSSSSTHSLLLLLPIHTLSLFH